MAVWLLASCYWLLAFGKWLSAIGDWLSAIGYWLLAIGYWLLPISLGLMLGVLRAGGPGGEASKAGRFREPRGPQWLGR